MTMLKKETVLKVVGSSFVCVCQRKNAVLVHMFGAWDPIPKSSVGDRDRTLVHHNTLNPSNDCFDIFPCLIFSQVAFVQIQNLIYIIFQQ